MNQTTRKMNVFPFFTEIDSTLNKAEPGRDLLGLLPVWTTIAREVEPYLSSAVTQYRGFSLVLLSYYIRPRLNDPEEFRQFFKFMEVLGEYYFRFHLDIEPVFGKRQINSADEKQQFWLQSNTLTTGFYQYYRGTCRRGGMVSADWHLQQEASEILSGLCGPNSKAIKALVEQFESHKNSVTPWALFAQHEIKQLFDKLFKNNELPKYYRQLFFSDEQHLEYARLCYQYNEGGSLTHARNIAAAIESQPYRQALGQIIDCEPFLTVLVRCFSLMSSRRPTTWSQLAEPLYEETVLQAIKQKAGDFLKLRHSPCALRPSLFEPLFELARQAANGDIKRFLQTLAQYHGKVMEGRGKASVLLVEGEKVRSLTDLGEASLQNCVEQMIATDTADNSYFIKTTAQLYRQLYLGRENTQQPS